MGDVSASALACRNLSVGYGARIVLADLSLDIAAGAWTAIVGPNGCGKSTVLRVLAGIAAPHAGSITLHSRPLDAWPRRARARRLTWLAQSFPATDLCVADVVALGRFAHGSWLAHRDIDDENAIRRAMAATGCQAWSGRRLSTLSGGERQRVHLARSLAVGASVMLLDEPTTHLDPPHQEEVTRLLRDTAHGEGASVVSAVHDLSLAMLADRLIVIGRRGLIGHGTVAQALAGDWLSEAFGTRVTMIEHEGAYLWRPDIAAS